MSTQYIAVIVGLLSVFLPKMGVVVGSEELTSIVSSIFFLASSLWVLYQRTMLEKAPMGRGDVDALGFRK